MGGGQARMVASAAGALVGRGHRVDVYSFGAVRPAPGLEARRVTRGDFLSGRFFRWLRDGRYDVVHTHGYSSLAPAKALLAEITQRATRVLTPHFHEAGGYPLAVRRAYDLSLGSAVCRAAHQIQVDTQFEKEALTRLQRIPEGRFEVIPPSLGGPFVGSAPPARGPPAGEFRVLFVGRLEPYKGVDTLVSAVAGLNGKGGRPVRLTIAGADPTGGAFAAPEGTAEFLGPVDDGRLLSLYDTCGALALPSKAEAFGIVLLEAMSRGLPVVAARAGGIPHFVNDGENGLLVEYGDAAGLESAIDRLASDEALWRRLSKAGRETAGAYTPEVIAGRTEAAYRRAVAAT